MVPATYCSQKGMDLGQKDTVMQHINTSQASRSCSLFILLHICTHGISTWGRMLNCPVCEKIPPNVLNRKRPRQLKEYFKIPHLTVNDQHKLEEISLEVLLIDTLQLKDLAPHDEENTAGHTQWQKVTYTDHAQEERPEHIPVMAIEPHTPRSSCVSITIIYPSATALVYHNVQPFGREVESMVFEAQMGLSLHHPKCERNMLGMTSFLWSV